MKALILVDHGSKLPEANQLLVDMVTRIGKHGGFRIAVAAHMELAKPSIAEAFDACVAAGATDITIGQYFLGPGRHSTKDIPLLAAAAATTHPEVAWRVTEPLGNSVHVMEALLEKIREASR